MVFDESASVYAVPSHSTLFASTTQIVQHITAAGPAAIKNRSLTSWTIYSKNSPPSHDASKNREWSEIAEAINDVLGRVLINPECAGLGDVRIILDSVAKVPKGRAANFPRKNEISDNRRSMYPQARCRNRL